MVEQKEEVVELSKEAQERVDGLKKLLDAIWKLITDFKPTLPEFMSIVKGLDARGGASITEDIAKLNEERAKLIIK